MFNKKPRRNFRQRKGGSSDEEQGEKNTEEDKGHEQNSFVLNKPHKLPQNRGISCSSKREKPPSKSDSDAEEEDLEEPATEKRPDKASTLKAQTALSFSEEGGESVFKLKKSTNKSVLFQLKKKPSTSVRASNKSDSTNLPTQEREQTGDQASPLSSIHDSDDNENCTILDDCRGVDDKGGVDVELDSLSPQSSSESSYKSLFTQVFPCAKEIAAAKKCRRLNRTKKEYIPLDKDDHGFAASTPDRFSTKDEENQDDDDDDDDEFDDHERRIEFAPKPKSVRERIAEQMGDTDDSLSGDDGEQELWEETQIGKGVKRRPGEQSPSGSESSCYGSGRYERQRQKKCIPALPSISISMIKKRISVELDSLKEVHRARRAEYLRMEGDIENARCSADNLEDSSCEIELRFYRDMTLYTHNLVECLREKIVEINSLELEMYTLLSEQMETLLAGRRLKVKEQAEHLQQLSYETVERTANGKTIEGDPALTLKTQTLPEDLQPSPDELELCQKQMDDILMRSKAVFSDVKEDFHDVKKILSRFEEWRRSHSDSYHNAYISLCLPKLLHPIIRHQLLSWNPLKETSEDFENMPWFTALETFCHGHGHEELEITDRQTLTNVIEKTLFPKLTAYVEMAWDPLSMHQTASLMDLCHRLKEDYPIFEGEPSKPVKAFIDAVAHRLRDFVDEDIFIPIFPKRFLEDLSSPQCQFRNQQLWTAIKLLCIMGKWELVLPEFTLKELMLDKLLSRYLMIALSNCTLTTIDACKKIAGSLPSSWFREGDSCLPKLQTFNNYLVQMAHSICKEQSPEEPSTKTTVVEVLKILSCIRCYDSIMAITERYHYEDVIYAHQLLNQDAEGTLH